MTDFKMPESISFGWGAPKISEQFAGSGVDADTLVHFDRDSEAVSRLSVRGVIPRSEAEKAYKRIQKRLEGDLLKVRARSRALSDLAALDGETLP